MNDIDLTAEQYEILGKELDKQEFWTVEEVKDRIRAKLGLELSDDQVVKLLEDKFKRQFSIYRLSIGAILAESGMKERKRYSLEESESVMWKRIR